MDATRLRALIDGAIEAQRVLDAAREAEAAAKKAVELAVERHRQECGNLRSAFDGFAIYGDKVVRVGNDAAGLRVVVSPLVTVPVVAPPPAPLPEAKPPAPKPSPLSGGTVPEVKKAR